MLISDILLHIHSYLNQPSVDATVDVLDWWRRNQEIYPNLSRMARDFLAIPATSVPSERIFSEAGQIITSRRNRLNADTVRACICLDSWWSSDVASFKIL